MSDVNEAWNYLFNQILLEANMMCPLTTFKFKRDRPPWYIDELRDLSVNRDYIYKVATRSGDPTDFEHAIGSYAIKLIQVSNLLRPTTS